MEKTLERPLILEEFLEEKEEGLFRTFLDEIDDQGWSDPKDYRTIEEIISLDPSEWISNAFLWEYKHRDDSYWASLSEEWEELVNFQYSNGRIETVQFYGTGQEEIGECTFCGGTGKREYTLFHHRGTNDGVEKCEICDGTGTIVYNIPY